MAQDPATLAARCAHCPTVIEVRRSGEAIPGVNQETAIVKACAAAVVAHLTEKHPEVIEQIIGLTERVSEALAFCHTLTSDPRVQNYVRTLDADLPPVKFL